jgi:hypothetical protein
MLSGTLSGTDLNYAYINDMDMGAPSMNEHVVAASPKRESSAPKSPQPPPAKHIDDEAPSHHHRQHTHHHQPMFVSPEEKIDMLTNELRRQREASEQQRSVGYLDKLLSKKKDILRMLMFACVVLLALSVHCVAEHYYKVFFDNTILTPWREFAMRAVYPLLVMFVLWNVRAFVK